MLSNLYAAIARRRREFYAARPDRRRRLRHPVISIGNLAVGGRGKTPVVACVTKLLIEMGERPAVLSRGYARRHADDGVVVVRDRDGIRADLDRSGDEPLMLARQLPGAAVLSSADRYTAGRLAEEHLAATVHVLDDGFQHLQLDRDIDLVIVAGEDLGDQARTLPGGRLREAPDTLVAADAVLAADEAAYAHVGGSRQVLTPGAHGGGSNQVLTSGAHGGGSRQVLTSGAHGGGSRQVLTPGAHGGGSRQVLTSGAHGGDSNQVLTSGAHGGGSNQVLTPGAHGGDSRQVLASGTHGGSAEAPYATFRLRRVVGDVPRVPMMAVAGIARPERFFADLRAAGHEVVATASFADHHPYTRRELERLAGAARRAGAAQIVTTEKDFVRLLPFRPFAVPISWLPLTMEPDPLPDFRSWLAGALNDARGLTRVD